MFSDFPLRKSWKTLQSHIFSALSDWMNIRFCPAMLYAGLPSEPMGSRIEDRTHHTCKAAGRKWGDSESRNMISNSIWIFLGIFLVLTILKNISQWEGLSHILWKIKNVWNHQPDKSALANHLDTQTNLCLLLSIASKKSRSLGHLSFPSWGTVFTQGNANVTPAGRLTLPRIRAILWFCGYQYHSGCLFNDTIHLQNL